MISDVSKKLECLKCKKLEFVYTHRYRGDFTDTHAICHACGYWTKSTWETILTNGMVGYRAVSCSSSDYPGYSMEVL